MKLLLELWRKLVKRQSEPKGGSPAAKAVEAAKPYAAVAAAVPVPVELPAPPEQSSRKAAKQAVTSVDRVAAVLRKNPSATAAEIAAQTGLSVSHARRLARRVREAQPSAPRAVACMPVAVPSSAPPVNNSIEQLNARLDEAERALDLMRRTPPSVRGNWNLNRRAQVLNLHGAGQDVESIASQLAIPSGEVAFILKIHRLTTAVQ